MALVLGLLVQGNLQPRKLNRYRPFNTASLNGLLSVQKGNSVTLYKNCKTGEVVQRIDNYDRTDSAIEVIGADKLRRILNYDDVYNWDALCFYCNTNTASYDSEPFEGKNEWNAWSSWCDRCFNLLHLPNGELHTHDRWWTKAQLSNLENYQSLHWRQEHTPAQHTWSDAVSVRPVFDKGEHKGWVCADHDESCGFFRAV